MRDLETLLHGHLPATDATTGVVLVLCDRRADAGRTARAKVALQACARIGIACAAITTHTDLADLAPAGVVPVPAADGLPAPRPRCWAPPCRCSSSRSSSPTRATRTPT